MRHTAKKTDDKGNDKRKSDKDIIPPDVFDDSPGVKVFIPDEKLNKNENGKSKREKEPEENSLVNDKKEDDFEDLNSKEEELEKDAGSDNIKLKEPQAEESEVDKDSGEAEEASFYEKVLGEKPPEKSGNDDSDEVEKEGLNRSLFFLGGVVFVMTILIASAIGFIFFNSLSPKKAQNTPQFQAETPTQEPSPEPSQVPFDKSGFTFEVLNGSGEGGKAGRTGDAIEELGYTVETVGNADATDYVGMEVGFSEDVSSDDRETILSDLEKEFLNVSEDEDLEPETTDILVIIGK